LKDNETWERDEDLELDLWRVKVSGLMFMGLAALAVILIFAVFLIGMQIPKLSGIEMSNIVPDFKDVGFIVTDNAWVWQSPSETSPRTFNLARGTGVFVLKEADGWTKIWIQGQSGWVKSSDIITKADKKKRKDVLASSLEIVELKDRLDDVGNLVVVGTIANRSDIPVMNVRVRIDVYDADGNLSDRASIYVATREPLVKDKPQTFTHVFARKSGGYMVEASIESWQ